MPPATAAGFVSKDDFHAAIRPLATREEMHARIDRLEQRMEAGFAELRREIDARFAQQRVESKATARLIFSALISIIVLVAGSILA